MSKSQTKLTKQEHNTGMSKTSKVSLKVRSNLHNVMGGRKNAAHTPRDEKRAKDKLRRLIEES